MPNPTITEQEQLINVQKAIAAKAQKKAEKESAGLTIHWTRSDAIRAKCLECSGRQPSEVRRCLIPSCALYPFRLSGCIPANELKEWENKFKASDFGKWFVHGHDGVSTGEETEEIVVETAKVSPKVKRPAFNPETMEW